MTDRILSPDSKHILFHQHMDASFVPIPVLNEYFFDFLPIALPFLTKISEICNKH